MSGQAKLVTWSHWTTWVPFAAAVLLALTWGSDPAVVVVVLIATLLAGAVLAAVHHAEVIALRVGEPFGSLVLAIAVTIIEVALIVTLMISGGDKTETLARDTIFSAVIISVNGIVGLCILVSAFRHRIAIFNAEGAGTALAAVATVATLSLVLPSFTTGEEGAQFTPGQLTFAAISSLLLYLLFVSVQTVRHRDYFLPVSRDGGGLIDVEEHADPPPTRVALTSLGLLVVSLVAVVGLAKTVSPAIEDGVEAAGLRQAVVGVIIAMLVLAPETLAAVRAARRDRMQTSLNLGLGSAMAAVGLSIPTIAVASIWLDGPLVLGLGATETVLLALTVVVGTLTVVPGRATPVQGGVHLALLATYIFLVISP